MHKREHCEHECEVDEADAAAEVVGEVAATTASVPVPGALLPTIVRAPSPVSEPVSSPKSSALSKPSPKSEAEVAEVATGVAAGEVFLAAVGRRVGRANHAGRAELQVSRCTRRSGRVSPMAAAPGCAGRPCTSRSNSSSTPPTFATAAPFLLVVSSVGKRCDLMSSELEQLVDLIRARAQRAPVLARAQLEALVRDLRGHAGDGHAGRYRAWRRRCACRGRRR